MALQKKYQPQDIERHWSDYWQRVGVYHFSLESSAETYSIDSPPATVSGRLHLGHVYSYTHPDIFARFWRMRGRKVFYPMGYDDNGLPTERLVEKTLGITAPQVGREKFIQTCLQFSDDAEKEYESLWKRLGLSVDWRYTYRTIDSNSRRICQQSFIDLYKKGKVYRRESPAIWCPECQTSIAQAELNDHERESLISTIIFPLDNGQSLPIATTRPELMPACVAIFVPPKDARYAGLFGRTAHVPIFGQQVPVLADEKADPEKGTGAVMCCTFGDSTDVAWWHEYQLPLVEAIEKDGKLSKSAGPFEGMDFVHARQQILKALGEAGRIHEQGSTIQSVRIHERCDTPVEYIIVPQWFIRLLDYKRELLEIGEQVSWHPEHMKNRYLSWVENLNWDWCISRQRTFGVPFPVWYCQLCGQVALASEDQLPVDPLQEQPAGLCECGSHAFTPENDVFDTWATSSMTPQIVAGWSQASGDNPSPELYNQVYPFSLRPQAHEIIRTWAFYTLVKSYYHFAEIPWSNVLISGWGVAGEGMGKISKSRGGGPMPPMEMIQQYSADAVRYWAASTGPGKDSIISEEKIKIGSRLLTKLWNAARFCEPFRLGDSEMAVYESAHSLVPFTPADLWILAQRQSLVRRTTELLEKYEYAAAKSEIEGFFWTDLADNYLEMCKQRLYGDPNPLREAARFTLQYLVDTVIHLLAPFLPFITEEIYQSFLDRGGKASASTPAISIHRSAWPVPDPGFEDEQALYIGTILVGIATAVRRYKSEHNLALSTELDRLLISAERGKQRKNILQTLMNADADLKSVTRARNVEIADYFDPDLIELNASDHVWLSIRE